VAKMVQAHKILKIEKSPSHFLRYLGPFFVKFNDPIILGKRWGGIIAVIPKLRYTRENECLISNQKKTTNVPIAKMCSYPFPIFMVLYGTRTGCSPPLDPFPQRLQSRSAFLEGFFQWSQYG
jgi:hypothetical protein